MNTSEETLTRYSQIKPNNIKKDNTSQPSGCKFCSTFKNQSVNNPHINKLKEK